MLRPAAQITAAESGRGRAQPRDVGAAWSTEHPRSTNQTPPARRRRPTGAVIPRVLFPGPRLPWAGNKTRHKFPPPKASDVPCFWLGRSAARRLLIPQPPQEPGEQFQPKQTTARCLCGVFLETERKFSKKKKTDREVEQPIINNASSKNSISPLAQIRSRSLASRG